MKSKVKLVSDRSYGLRNDDRCIEAIYHSFAALPLPPDSWPKASALLGNDLEKHPDAEFGPEI